MQEDTLCLTEMLISGQSIKPLEKLEKNVEIIDDRLLSFPLSILIWLMTSQKKTTGIMLCFENE